MQGGCRVALISSPMRCSDGAKSVEQIGSSRPLAPNWLTKSEMRTLGSAKPAGSVSDPQECAITGHGHVCIMVLQDVSIELGAFQATVYGVAGPVIAATMTWPGSFLRPLILLAVSTALSRKPSVSFDMQAS